LNVFLANPNETIKFPNYNYSEFVNASIDGTIMVNN